MIISFLKVPFFNSFLSLVISACWLLTIAQTGVVSAETISSPAIMEITVRGNLISAKLIDAPLIDVLQRIKKEFGFKAHFYGDLTELTTMSFTDIPLDKCLRQLTANHSLSVVSRPTTTSEEENGAKQIADVWVLGRSTTSKNVNSKPAASVIASSNSADDMGNASEESSGQINNEEQDNVSSDELSNSSEVERSSQRQTIKDLAAVGDSDSVTAMAEFLNDEDKDLRRLSVNGISSVHNEEATQVLGQVLQQESDPEIRKIAVWALGQRKNDAAAQALLEGARNDADEEVKTLADQLLTQ